MDVLQGELDGALLTFTTNEPQQNQVIAATFNGSQALPGGNFEVVVFDISNTPRVAIFAPGESRTQAIPPGQRGDFVLGPVQKPDGSTVTMLLKPEYTFRRL